MATAEGEHKVAVKLLVDKEQNKVIYAEADNHFADILFSFLTLPLGTIIRLVGGGEQSDTEPGLKVGSLTNLYKSVEDLDLKFFSTEKCKDMLLYPRNDAELECQRLKVNIDDTEASKYFRCKFGCLSVSTCRNAPCVCGGPMSESLSYQRASLNSSNQEAIFFYNSTTLIIGDDLSIRPIGPTIIVELFTRFGITDLKLLTERVVHLGKKEILDLLKWSLISTTPLTDAFLRAGHRLQVASEPIAIIPPKNVEHNTNNSRQFLLKLLVRKSDNKVLFAQANEDFINQILSLLTVPLGLVVRLLGGNSSLGSVDQLYKSIMNQDLGTHLISRDPPEQNKLLNPKLAGYFTCEKQLLPLPVAEIKKIQFVTGVPFDLRESYELNPKLCAGPKGSKVDGGDFVKSPSAFIVTDDLVVKPISSLTSVAFLERLNIPKNDIEEKAISFGIDQAYKLLKGSLLSESALTQALTEDDILRTPNDSILRTPKRRELAF